MDIILATQNLHKVREYRGMLEKLEKFKDLEIISLHDLNDYTPPEETGETFQENALLKAQHASFFFNKWALADDSGLVIPSLNGAPGVYSARYAGKGSSDSENRKKLMEKIKNINNDSRMAYFECCIAISAPDGFHKCVRGTCEGTILDVEKGNNGFGYDPIFVKSGYKKTFAQLDETIKNKVSHRRKALDQILLLLENLLEN